MTGLSLLQMEDVTSSYTDYLKQFSVPQGERALVVRAEIMSLQPFSSLSPG